MSTHVSSNVWRSCPQIKNHRIVMLSLADWCTDGGLCYASRAELAKRVPCTERNVQRLIQDLIRDGDITVVRKGNGRGNATVYLLERYSEGGVLTDFKRETFSTERETKPVNKGGAVTEQSVLQRKTNTNTTSGTTEAVDNIYAAYPRKVAKPAAIKAIAKASMKTPLDKLFALTKAYAAAVAGSDDQFIPYPATWFNQERYNDDPKTWIRTESRNGKRPRPKVITSEEYRNAEF